MHNLFARLPAELLLEIFTYELLVPYRQIQPYQKEVTYSQGITIIDGHAEHPYPCALFKVDRRTSWLARTCAFSTNRFILGGEPESSAAWLASQPRELTKLIQRLDLLVLPYQLYEDERLNGFSRLLAVLDIHLELSNLCLSVDASRICQELNPRIYSHDWLETPYHKLQCIFEEQQDIRSVMNFFVYYPQYGCEEVKLEKSIKGNDYSSFARGKEGIGRRDYRLIHGWEYGIFRADGFYDLNPDWKNYTTDPVQGSGVFPDAF